MKANKAAIADHLLTTGIYDSGGYSVGDDLYFIASDAGFVKIGRSGSLASRLSTLQNASPYKVFLLMYLPGMGWQEKVWHAAFKHIRERGEWFRDDHGLHVAIEAARAGDEWIATLRTPIVTGPRSINDNEDDYVWRDHVADLEEALQEKLHDRGLVCCDEPLAEIDRLNQEVLG